MPVKAELLRQQLESGRRHKRQRVTSNWKPNDDAYNGKVRKYAKLRYNFHLPILSGFEDTLIAKQDEAPAVRFGGSQPGEIRKGRMYDALWEELSSRPECDYAAADLMAKRKAARYGRAFLKLTAQSDPFAIDLESIDPYDMVTDPNGGGDLEDHLFVIQDGIFRTEKQLKDGIKEKGYDPEAVDRILKGPESSKEEYKLEADLNERYASLNQSGYAYESSGIRLYRLCEHVTYGEDGERYLLVWNPESGEILSESLLKEKMGDDLLPWVSWAPYEDDKVFWSKAPDDDVRQAAEAERITVMELMHNVQNQNWGMRAYDPERFPETSLLLKSPDGLVPSAKGAASMPGGLAGGIYELQTPPVPLAMNVVGYLDRFVGQKSGVTPDAEGTSQEDVLGIYEGNLEQVSDRMGLQSRSYRRAQERIAVRFLWLAKTYLKGKRPVKIIGAEGNELIKLMAKDIDPTVGISIIGGTAEATVTEAKRRERGQALDAITANPLLVQSMNAQAIIEERLRSSGFDEDEIRVMLDPNADTRYRDQQLRASESVEQILEGKRPPLYPGATTVFVKTVLEAAREYTDSEGPDHDRLIAFANAHMRYAAQNAAFRAMEDAAFRQLSPIGEEETLTEQPNGQVQGAPVPPGPGTEQI